jgi:hypothetical protein
VIPISIELAAALASVSEIPFRKTGIIDPSGKVLRFSISTPHRSAVRKMLNRRC